MSGLYAKGAKIRSPWNAANRHKALRKAAGGAFIPPVRPSDDDGSPNKAQKAANEWSEKYEDEKCSICLNPLGCNCKWGVIGNKNEKCEHYYHVKCILKWINKNGNGCPLCREKWESDFK